MNFIFSPTAFGLFSSSLEDGRQRKGLSGKRAHHPPAAASGNRRHLTNARAVAGPVLSAGDNYLRLRDALTEEEMEIKLLRPMKVADSAYAIAIVVPFGDEKIFFWEPFDYKSPLKGYEEEFLQKGFAESEYDDPKEFWRKNFY